MRKQTCVPRWGLLFFIALGWIGTLPAATFGTVFPLVGGATDIVVDAPRQRLYLVGVPDTLQVYSIPQRRILASIRTDSLPLQAAMSRDGRSLYVTCHNASSLNVVDLETLQIRQRVSLPARPEGVAVGRDERVLISTIGTGPGNTQNTLLLYDPAPDTRAQLSAIPVTLPPPTPPQVPAPSGRVFQINRAQLTATNDGSLIVGMNLPNATTRVVFVYEVASGTVLRSRAIAGASSVISIAPDNSRFMAGLSLIEMQTLEVLAQQNLANAPYPIPANTNFNTQVNQGGSVFAPDGSRLYSAFNVAPVANPPARANIAQLMFSDPDNLLIEQGIQMPENLAGKMVITPDGGNLFALSESGLVQVPLAQIAQQPIAMPSSTAVLLTTDQCGVTANQRAQQITVRNMGGGNLGPVQPLLIDENNNPSGLGGVGGPGGGLPGGGGGVIVGPGGPIVIPGFPGQPANNAGNALLNTAPAVTAGGGGPGGGVPGGGGAATGNLTFTFNLTANRSIGTVSPAHNFLVQANNAINLPPRVRVYQNNRNSEARGEVRPIPVGISQNERLTDIAYDAGRRRVYVANSGLNRVEVFDTRTNQFLAPIKVGQLPRSIALSLDGSQLYVANSGGENISIVDLERGRQVGRIRMPPIPFNTNVALITPSVLAVTQRGLIVIMNNGTIWRAIGDELVPRNISPLIGTATIPAPRTLTATPNGEFALLYSGGNGTAYLYDAISDEFVQARQIFATAQARSGYNGPIAAGPRGSYFVINGTVLNQALTPLSTAQSIQPGAPVRPGQPIPTVNTPISAVAPVGTSSYLRLANPVRAQAAGGGAGNNPNALPAVTEAPALELVDANTGLVTRRVDALEGPIQIVTGTQQANVDGRTIVSDPAGTVAYALTSSGLSIVPLDATSPLDRPLPNQNGTVSMANFLPNFAPGGLISIFGRNLGTAASSSANPLPSILGGVCVTLNNNPLPLTLASPTQVNAQLPVNLTPGNYQLTVRNIDRRAVSVNQIVRVTRYAPAVFFDGANQQPAIFHLEGGFPVTKQRPLTRDKRALIYATGLGVTRGPVVVTGRPAPENAVTDRVQVFFGDARFSQAEMIVESSTLVPGMVGVYQIQIYVPGDRMRGDALPVTLRIGGVNSPLTGPAVPTVAVE